MLVIVMMIIFGVLGAAIASGKNRNVLGWGLLCALFPLIALLILLCMPKLTDERFELAKQQLELQRLQVMQASMQGRVLPEGDTMECPKCAEIIKAKAAACRFCNYELHVDSTET